jgi:hypothetical protein
MADTEFVTIPSMAARRKAKAEFRKCRDGSVAAVQMTRRRETPTVIEITPNSAQLCASVGSPAAGMQFASRVCALCRSRDDGFSTLLRPLRE